MTMYFILMLFYQVKQEAVKMESSSSASHMSPTVCKTSPAGMLIKSKGKIPKKGTQERYPKASDTQVQLLVSQDFCQKL